MPVRSRRLFCFVLFCSVFVFVLYFQVTNLILLTWGDEPLGLLHVYVFGEIAVQECGLHVQLDHRHVSCCDNSSPMVS